MTQIAGANAGQCGDLDVLGTANRKWPNGSSILGLQLRPSSPVWTSSSTPPYGSRQSPRLPMAGRRSSSRSANHRDFMRLNLSRLHFIDFARTFAVVLALLAHSLNNTKALDRMGAD